MEVHWRVHWYESAFSQQMLERAGFRLLHQQSYCHIITLDYLLSKLTALGVPGADAVRGLAARLPMPLYVPFRFGDIQLYVCEKIAEVDAPLPRRASAQLE